MYNYLIKFSIYDDGDFNYDTQDELFKLCEDMSEIDEIVLNKLKNIYNTIKGKDYVIKTIKKWLKKEIKDIETFGFEGYVGEDFGNQSIDIYCSEIKFEDGFVKYLK